VIVSSAVENLNGGKKSRGVKEANHEVVELPPSSCSCIPDPPPHYTKPDYERAYPAPLMGRTNHYACQKKTDCTISDDAANTNNLLLFAGTDAKEGVSQSDFNGRIIVLWKPTDATTDSNAATLGFL